MQQTKHMNYNFTLAAIMMTKFKPMSIKAATTLHGGRPHCVHEKHGNDFLTVDFVAKSPLCVHTFYFINRYLLKYFLYKQPSFLGRKKANHRRSFLLLFMFLEIFPRHPEAERETRRRGKLFILLTFAQKISI